MIYAPKNYGRKSTLSDQTPILSGKCASKMLQETPIACFSISEYRIRQTFALHLTHTSYAVLLELLVIQFKVGLVTLMVLYF